jgi:nucleotide-binding universal stress UspA family protein
MVVRIAKVLDSELAILHITPGIPKRFHSTFETIEDDRGRTLLEQIEGMPNAANVFFDYADEILEEFDITAAKKKVRGELAAEILRESDKRYSMVVVGTAGLKGIERSLFGSVSYQVAEYAKIPVLVVKKDVELKNILACTDGSEAAKEAVYCAGHLGKALGAKVVLLSVAPTPSFEKPQYAELSAEMKERLHKKIREFPKPEKKYLEEGKDVLREIGIEARTKFREGRVVEEILREAKEGNYDLIVIGSRGLSKIKRLLMGHVSLKVKENADTNVLIVRNFKL